MNTEYSLFPDDINQDISSHRHPAQLADEKTAWKMSQAIAGLNHAATLIVLDNYQHNDLFNQPDSTFMETNHLMWPGRNAPQA